MNLPRYSIYHRSIVLASVAVFIAVGLMNFDSMSRREDPEITVRDALIVTQWPGVSATRVEQLITEPIEDILLEIAEIDVIESESMVGSSVIKLTAGDKIKDVDQVWDDVRAKVAMLNGQLPQGASLPFVNSDFGDVYEIVYSLSASTETPAAYDYSYRQLEQLAEAIEEAIEPLDSVAKVSLWGSTKRTNLYRV